MRRFCSAAWRWCFQLFFVSLLIFELQQLLPGDPALVMPGEECDPAQVSIYEISVRATVLRQLVIPSLQASQARTC